MTDFKNSLDVIWLSIIAYSMVQGYLLFLIFPTYQKGSKQAKWLLAAASLLCAILLTEELLSHIIGYETLPHLIFSVSPLWYLLGPAIYLYIRHYATQSILTRNDIWHLLPALWIVLSSLDFYGLPGDAKVNYIRRLEDNGTHPIHNINFVIFSIQSVYYLITSWLMVKPGSELFQRKQEHQWILQLVIGLGGMAMISFLSVVTLNVHVSNLWWVGSSYFILVSGFLLSLFVRSVRSPRELYLIGRPLQIKLGKPSPGLHESYTELLQYLEVQKPYRDPEFDLQTLSKQLGYSKHALSLLIKEQTGLGFRDFINKIRLEEAKEKLSSSHSKQFTIQSIANDAGFKSLATFYRAFKKMEGKPPKSFIN